MAAQPRLGRGLNALIVPRDKLDHKGNRPVALHGDNASESTNAENVTDGKLHINEVLLELIDDNPNQPRTTMDSVALTDLANSIRTHGILQPVLLKRAGERYQLVAGHRRTAAAKIAGISTVPAIIRSDTTPEQQVEWALIENIQRQDLNPIERANAYRAYIERFSITHSQAAERLGEDRTSITNYLRLLDLPDGVQDLIRSGSLSTGHAKVLAGINDKQLQITMATLAAQGDLSVRRLEALCRGGGAATTNHSTKTGMVRTPNVLELEQNLARQLGTRLRIIPSRKKGVGKVVILYSSLDEFERIFGMFKIDK